MDVTLNADMQLYVIPSGDGYSCLGFDNARGHADLIAERLGRRDLAFAEGEHGTLAGYARYCTAVHAWGRSPLAGCTYFGPGTDPQAARVLEACRRDGRKVRLMLGDTATGRCWLEEHGVVGCIGRSTGTLKVPLLVEPGAGGGGSILTDCLLRIVEWDTGRDLYRHRAYRLPKLALRHTPEEKARAWQVLQGGTVAAAFSDAGRAGAYLAFMCGETVEPRIFQ
ncbi:MULTISPECIES: hypothetical protein [Comamonadaceae]|jgi:hypothetical protein|uniref:Uncharacterized protein n=2 Tax=Comamonadaceae TaxID=80864 RepID=A0A1I2E2Q4_9BURK|nr:MULTISPECIES: hypothetical protein [Comamonadaceae]OJX31503.1 MAG: hypothetical protein BGO74_06115 [Burkholderiales bacterium 68-12]GAO20864.1 hypothetical protein ALISP_0684 [Alicycliphilus sp. B1]MDR7092884.1 hypothetical protein [Hydrogenophaga laconesensis]NCU65541.1 hypothetical protein [Acidovorax sp. 210-6]POR09655.1 hypothetical protein BV908_14265 [Diaphorobacter sp. LR2014-1]